MHLPDERELGWAIEKDLYQNGRYITRFTLQGRGAQHCLSTISDYCVNIQSNLNQRHTTSHNIILALKYTLACKFTFFQLFSKKMSKSCPKLGPNEAGTISWSKFRRFIFWNSPNPSFKLPVDQWCVTGSISPSQKVIINPDARTHERTNGRKYVTNKPLVIDYRIE